MKVFLLLDKEIVESKTSKSFIPANHLDINQIFEFSALSSDLGTDKNDSPQERTTDELLSNTSSSSRNKLIVTDVPKTKTTYLLSETLGNNMGILISVRAITRNKNRRVIGRMYIGRTDKHINDESFHWGEMIKCFDNTITQWHHLQADKF